MLSYVRISDIVSSWINEAFDASTCLIVLKMNFTKIVHYIIDFTIIRMSRMYGLVCEIISVLLCKTGFQ